MKFNSIGASNAGNYAQAGKSVVDSAANVFNVQRKTGPDYAEISKTAMVTQAEENITAMKAAEKVVNAGVNAFSKVKQISNNEKAKRERNEINRNLKSDLRKAGSIAGLGKLAGAGFLAASDPTKGREYPTADFKGFFEKWRANRDGIKARQDQERAALGEYNPPPVKLDTPTIGGNAGKITTGGGSNTASQSGSGATGNNIFDMSKLTSKDYADLAFAVSSEAALGTDDEYGVAANILTRLKSGKYGNSVHQIIHAPGQYEGVYKGMSVNSPDIAARFQSPEGQAKILSFMQTLNGRTEFKGQSMLRNRVAAEDPMFHPKGNFYHYAGQ